MFVVFCWYSFLNNVLDKPDEMLHKKLNPETYSLQSMAVDKLPSKPQMSMISDAGLKVRGSHN